MQSSLVSIIVPTKNSMRTLEACLDSIKSQSYTEIELIVVDNFSDDETFEASKKYTSHAYQVGPERCRQRNFGFEKATGKYLMYIDSDMVLDKEVVAECVELYIKRPEIGGITIHEDSFGEGFWTQCKVLERKAYVGDETIEGVRCIDRDVIARVGAFNEELVSGEDWDLVKRIKAAGYPVASINARIGHDEGTISIIGLWKKKLYYGQFINDFVSENKNEGGVWYMLKRIYIFRPSLWGQWREYLKKPHHFVGMVIMLTGELIFGAIGFIKHKIK